LETVDRRFQDRSRTGAGWGRIEKPRTHSVVSGTARRSFHEPAKSV
jgi:hypothetical protein